MWRDTIRVSACQQMKALVAQLPQIRTAQCWCTAARASNSGGGSSEPPPRGAKGSVVVSVWVDVRTHRDGNSTTTHNTKQNGINTKRGPTLGTRSASVQGYVCPKCAQTRAMLWDHKVLQVRIGEAGLTLSRTHSGWSPASRPTPANQASNATALT